jgi:hypothetical protein
VGGGKKPRFNGWQQEATTDRATIEQLWTASPDANIGWATGDGLIAVDVDVKNGKPGDATLFQLELTNSDIPATLTNHTATGGRHLLLRSNQPVKNSSGKALGPGLDVRGEGGYVVGAGSTIDGVAYAADWAEPAEAPAWLVQMAGRPIERQSDQPVADLDTPAAVVRAEDYLLFDAPDSVEGDGGDHTAFTVAARLRDFAISESKALDLMLEHWNENCSPPWDPDELQQKVENAYRYASLAPGNASPQADFETELLPQLEPAGDLRGYDFDDVQLDLEDRFVLEGIFDENTIADVFGEPGSGKSVLVLMLSHHIATGKPWAGRDVTRSSVLYCALEGPTGTKRRVLAIRQALAADKHTPIRIIEGPLNLAKAASVQAVIDEAQRLARKTGIPTRLIVIDTLAKAMAGSDENSGKDMGVVLSAADAIRRATGACVCLVHHSGKDANKGARGHSSLKGAVDHELQVTEKGGVRMLTGTKMRDDKRSTGIPYIVKEIT